MAANLTIDKIFADNLGTAFGGCVRDQSLNLFSPEIARSAGANWNPLPFFGRGESAFSRPLGSPPAGHRTLGGIGRHSRTES